MAAIHALKVLVYAEGKRLTLIICLEVCLSSFEAFYTIVQSGVGWVKHEVANGLYSRRLPASVFFVVVAV